MAGALSDLEQFPSMGLFIEHRVLHITRKYISARPIGVTLARLFHQLIILFSNFNYQNGLSRLQL